MNTIIQSIFSYLCPCFKVSKCSDQLNTSLKNGSNLTATGVGGDGSIPPSIQAYKSDNAKLIKENNELHLQLIKIKDDFELEIKELKSKLHKVDHENSDLRFLNTQYLHKLRAAEKESKDKSKKIIELQEKNFQAVIQTPGILKLLFLYYIFTNFTHKIIYSSAGNKQTISFRRQRLDIDCMLPESSSNSMNGDAHNKHLALTTDPYIIDMVKLADERIAQMQIDLDNYKQANEIVETKVSNYKNQVDKYFYDRFYIFNILTVLVFFCCQNK